MNQTYTGTFDFGDIKSFKGIVALFNSRKAAAEPLICTYAITCLTTGQKYIGSTENLMKRWQRHLWLLLNSQHKNTNLQKLFDEYGASDFTIEILKQYPNTDDLLLLEEIDGQKHTKIEMMLNFRLGSSWLHGFHAHNCSSRFPNRPKTRTPGRNQKDRWFDHTAVRT